MKKTNSDIEDNEDLQLFEKINLAINAVNNVQKDTLADLIKIYNPKQSLDFKHENADHIAKRLGHIYYSNDFYFSRLLIIRYMKYFDAETAFIFLKELWDVSDLVCRLELIIAFNEREHKNLDQVFFERQCKECVAEIIWTEASIYDIAELKKSALESELNDHRALLIYQLFQLLKAIYEPSVIQVIYDIIRKNDGDIENQLFALELLDITLRPGLKEIIKPILEPIDFENKKQKLEKAFHIYQVAPKDRLIDILMKDYNLVGLQLKETALVVYNRVTDEKDVLSAFRTNSIENLKFKADEIYRGVTDPIYQAKKEVLTRLEDNYNAIQSFGPYLLNYAIYAPTQHKFNVNIYSSRIGVNQPYIIDLVSTSNVPIKLDSLALALLLTLKQRQLANQESAALMDV